MLQNQAIARGIEENWGFQKVSCHLASMWRLQNLQIVSDKERQHYLYVPELTVLKKKKKEFTYKRTSW